MASPQENRDFIGELVSTDLLDDAIEWIKNNLEPDEVFSVEELDNWAIDNDFARKEKI